MGDHEPTRLLFLALRCEPGAPRSARIALSTVLHPGQSHDDAALVTSELVTNAVQFSGCTAAEHITLTVARHGDGLRIAVHDPAHTTQQPHQREPDRARVGGQGLRIVAQLARRWGVETEGNGRTVWAELPGPVGDEEPPARSGLRLRAAIHPKVIASHPRGLKPDGA
ncbi:MAG TPA: ATP-binding protein [Solirubrobacteraceae bacterium]